MSVSTKLLKHPRTITVLSHLLAGIIRFIFASNRKIRLIDEAAQPYVAGEKKAVFVFWHGRMMLLPVFYALSRRMHVLISHHRDGILISQVIGHFGLATISGSSSRGAKGAVREMLRVLAAGENVGITPDGPRGPTQQILTDGAVSVARLADVPIIPVTFSASRCIRLGSWDRFMVALPFGRAVVVVGAPLWINENADDAALRKQLEQTMNALVVKADEVAGA